MTGACSFTDQSVQTPSQQASTVMRMMKLRYKLRLQRGNLTPSRALQLTQNHQWKRTASTQQAKLKRW
ncbi:hypothetical protein RRG08_011655 [Elysia crispata]|uniref:Uncharacterized protein n=1 Tax=Elysia crispata TaxID=231223 RepID=A0AAE1D0R3_9GAST|nr:hypothetical protein RRG08_011655 [Elysia crispata]